MKSAVNTAYDANVHRAAMLRLHEKSIHGKINSVLDEHERRLNDTVRSGLKRGAIAKEFEDTFDELDRVSRTSFIGLLKDQIEFQWQTVDAAIGKIWRTSRPDKIVPEEFMLKEKLVDNDTLKQAWSRVSKAERVKLEQVIRRGIAENKTAEEIAVLIRKGNVHRITRNHSEALVITAMTSVAAQADIAVLDANKGALHGWQYVAVLDTRTSDICRHRDGKVYLTNQRSMLPPAHFRCRSTIVPVFKSWEQMSQLEAAAQVRKQNLAKLTPAQKAYYDGLTPLREDYDTWLKRQPTDIQAKHLGDYERVRLLNEGKLTADQFSNSSNKTVGLNELKRLTYDTPMNDTRRFAVAKEQLDAMQLGAVNAEQLVASDEYFKTLRDYYVLQAGALDGNLSLTNYRGLLMHTKKAQKSRVLSQFPTEEQLKYNPITGRYEDIRLYQPDVAVLENSLRLANESDKLKAVDKAFIVRMSDDLESRMSVNERAVIVDNLRVILGRQRENGEQWGNLKGVIQAQLKFDIMNISDSLETRLRADSNPFKKLLEDSYIDPVLGSVQLQDLHDNFLKNISSRNKWQDSVAPKIANELRPIFNRQIPSKIKGRLSDRELQQFYLRFAHRLAYDQLPDRDAFAIGLGRDLFNLANLNGSRNEWYDLGIKLLESKQAKKFYEIETFGVQKRRMRSRMSGQYFGPYYDTQSYNLRITDKRIQDYAKLERKVDLGLRVSVVSDKNRLVFRKGYKTYFIDRGILGYEDTRIPITSTSSFSDFPDDFLDNDMVNALNWASQAKYKIDDDFYDFVDKLVYFQDDRGKAKYYNDLNEYRQYLTSRGDTYERFKSMAWLRGNGYSFSNHPFIDHRARIYDRGLISPQSGETFRPFLSTEVSKPLGLGGYNNLQDQIGAFLGGLDEVFEGNYNSLTFTGRKKIAERWRKELVDIGNAMLRKRPNDIRFILDHPMVARIDGEEQGKFFRLALETAKLDRYLNTAPGGYSEIGNLSHNGNKFAINDIFEIASDKPVTELPITSLSWIFKYDKPRAGRVAKADVDVPVIVFKDNGQWILADGLHRTARAQQLGKKNIKVKVISLGELMRAKIPNDGYTERQLSKLNNYKTSFAIEQDASSSGAQIIAITTKNKQLAELSNVIPTDRKKRLYDEIAAKTFSDPRFKELNKKLGLKEKDLQKAAKAQNMVTLYGAGERTGIMNVEGKLSKVLGKDADTLVVTASNRQAVLEEIDARIARVERYDPDTALELRALRQNVRDIFNKGIEPSVELMDELYFLSPQTRELVEKLAKNYDRVVTPDDFKTIANIMSEYLAEDVPILKEFTKFFGKLAQDYLVNAKPSKSDFDWKSIVKTALRGQKEKGYVLPDNVSRILGVKAGEPVSEKVLKRFGFWTPNGTLAEIINGVDAPVNRRTGAKYLKIEIAQVATLNELEIFYANNLPKSWTRVPWVNFDGKTLEQVFTQSFEERLRYKNKEGEWMTNIVQVAQKTEATWWEQVINKSGKINDIADATKARTAYAVNGNHSNDAVIVKRFHLWGKSKGIATSTIHDAFFTNLGDMEDARGSLRGIYADLVSRQSVKQTLDEMLARGLPKELYNQYLEEAKDLGIIPVAGRSIIGGKVITNEDILKADDILDTIEEKAGGDRGWYGVG